MARNEFAVTTRARARGSGYERHWLGLVLTQPPQRHKDTKAHKEWSKFLFVIVQKNGAKAHL